MKNAKRKVFLIIIFAIEVLVGSFLILKYYRYKLEQKKVLGESTVAVIEKEKIIPSQYEDLKYYWKYLPNQRYDDGAEWLSYKVVYNINNDSLNELYNYPIEKEENTYRIITLGDSFTHGMFVNTKDNWTEQLEVLLNKSIDSYKYRKIEVINLGMPGADIQYIVRRYQEIGQKYNPDLVLWLESGSGFSRFNEIANPITNECYLNNYEANLTKQKTGYDLCAKETLDKINQQYSDDELNKLIEDQYDIFFTLVDPKKVITFYFDSPAKKEKMIISKWKENYPEAFFLPYIPSPTMGERLQDDHPSKKGHTAIANSIFEYLNEEIFSK